jgi:uncharacterized membrane protein (DUF441 family)
MSLLHWAALAGVALAMLMSWLAGRAVHRP